MSWRIALSVVRSIATIAAVVFWFCRVSTATQFLIFVGSAVLLLICFGLSSGVDDSNTGYWPPKPYQPRGQGPTDAHALNAIKPREPSR
jgi:hypothetical protein